MFTVEACSFPSCGIGIGTGGLSLLLHGYDVPGQQKPCRMEGHTFVLWSEDKMKTGTFFR